VAVGAVQSELLSPDFPVKQGKYREFWQIWPELALESLVTSGIYYLFG
jgi:hypothetical protein